MITSVTDAASERAATARIQVLARESEALNMLVKALNAFSGTRLSHPAAEACMENGDHLDETISQILAAITSTDDEIHRIGDLVDGYCDACYEADLGGRKAA